MAGAKAGRAAGALLGALRASGLLDQVRRWRPATLAEFLGALQDLGAAGVLAHPAGARDALLHLGDQWPATVEALAHPSTLPAVLERRSSLRVPPIAAYTTAAIAGGGSAFVVAGSAPAAVEVAAVLGVVGATGIASAWAWRPRARRRDRRFTLRGSEALTARAETLVVQQSSVVVDPEEARASDRQLGAVHGAARTMDATESAARAAGLVNTAGALTDTPNTPAQRALVDELIDHRALLLEEVLRLQVNTHAAEARQRREDGASYQRLIDDLDP